MSQSSVLMIVVLGVVSALLATILTGSGRVLVKLSARLLTRAWRAIREPEWRAEALAIHLTEGPFHLALYLAFLPLGALKSRLGVDSFGEAVFASLEVLGSAYEVAIFMASAVSGIGCLLVAVAAAFPEGDASWLAGVIVALIVFRLLAIPLLLIRQLRACRTQTQLVDGRRTIFLDDHPADQWLREKDPEFLRNYNITTTRHPDLLVESGEAAHQRSAQDEPDDRVSTTQRPGHGAGSPQSANERRTDSDEVAPQ